MVSSPIRAMFLNNELEIFGEVLWCLVRSTSTTSIDNCFPNLWEKSFNFSRERLVVRRSQMGLRGDRGLHSSVLFCSVLFCSVLICSVLFCSVHCDAVRNTHVHMDASEWSSVNLVTSVCLLPLDGHLAVGVVFLDKRKIGRHGDGRRLERDKKKRKGRGRSKRVGSDQNTAPHR